VFVDGRRSVVCEVVVAVVNCERRFKVGHFFDKMIVRAETAIADAKIA
jgi:hypothetical protein